MTYVLMFLSWAIIGFIGFAFILDNFFKGKDEEPSLPLGILILTVCGPIVWVLFLIGIFSPIDLNDEDDDLYDDDDNDLSDD